MGILQGCCGHVCSNIVEIWQEYGRHVGDVRKGCCGHMAGTWFGHFLEYGRHMVGICWAHGRHIA